MENAILTVYCNIGYGWGRVDDVRWGYGRQKPLSWERGKCSVVHDHANCEDELVIWSQFSSCSSSGCRDLLTVYHIQVVLFRLGNLVESLLEEDDVSFRLPATGVQESRYSSPEL